MLKVLTFIKLRELTKSLKGDIDSPLAGFFTATHILPAA